MIITAIFSVLDFWEYREYRDRNTLFGFVLFGGIFQKCKMEPKIVVSCGSFSGIFGNINYIYVFFLLLSLSIWIYYCNNWQILTYTRWQKCFNILWATIQTTVPNPKICHSISNYLRYDRLTYSRNKLMLHTINSLNFPF